MANNTGDTEATRDAAVIGHAARQAFAWLQQNQILPGEAYDEMLDTMQRTVQNFLRDRTS